MFQGYRELISPHSIKLSNKSSWCLLSVVGGWMGLASILLNSTRIPKAMDSDASSHNWSESLWCFGSRPMLCSIFPSLGIGSLIAASGSFQSVGSLGVGLSDHGGIGLSSGSGRVLYRDCTLSRHFMTASLQLSPLVSGTWMVLWKFVPIQNRVLRASSSRMLWHYISDIITFNLSLNCYTCN